ncbi:heavy metal translocating P-type ATPase [Coraliomargarita akajimensis DSM 45221]|uniref:P-type Zn(2+) transporter n=2 Tax=Coraliomargarita TaxID=442430 RepID=D5EKG3_CORAD|nr:heavy metal translocating P-type ATPase [Coraliomargarita akajimensis DSM 45221]
MPAVVCTTGEAECDDLDVKLSRSWLRIGIACVFAGQGMVLSLALNMTPPEYGSVAYWVLHGGLIFSALLVMAFLGGALFASTFAMLRHRRLSIEGLFTLSLMGAFCGSLLSSLTGTGAVFYEIVSIVIAIYTVGRMLGERSQARMRLESDRVRERYDLATVRVDGAWQRRSVAAVAIGSRVRVEPGSPITVDGVVCRGVGYVRETALTGEPLPVVRHEGDPVRAGTWSEDGLLEIEVLAKYGDRELDQILAIVEDGAGRPSELQAQANRLIQYFLPIVAAVSICTGIYWGLTASWIEAVFNSMAVLLVACPCALGLATPVAIWQGLYRMAQLGLVSRDGALVDVLAQTRKLYFDKTGTLSESSMQVAELVLAPEFQSRRADILASIHSIESRLSHPVAQALASYTSGDCEVADLRVIAGQGVVAQTPLGEVCIGEPGLCAACSVESIRAQLHDAGGKTVYIFVDGAVGALAVIRERMREGVASVWQQLQALSIELEVLTGDPNPQVQLPGEVRVQRGLSAAAKEAIVAESVERGEMPVFVGDGINDSTAMSVASGAIAMGSGTGLARSSAGGQLPEDRLEALPEAIGLARSIRQVLRGNLIYAAAYNVLGMSLAAAGILHPVAAALIMLVSSFWVTGRALRLSA